MPRFLLLLLTLCLAACAMPKVDPAREAQADRAYELVRRNDAAGVKAMSTPALAGQDLTGVIWQMQAHVHASAPTRARTISWGQNTVNDDAAYEVVRLYTHPAGEVQATVTMLRIGDGPWQIDGLHVLRITPEVLKAYEAEVEAARFTLAGKSPAHYIVLVGTGLSVLGGGRGVAPTLGLDGGQPVRDRKGGAELDDRRLVLPAPLCGPVGSRFLQGPWGDRSVDIQREPADPGAAVLGAGQVAQEGAQGQDQPRGAGFGDA
jgi:hypothetical protein